jgi:hypothetical protein
MGTTKKLPRAEWRKYFERYTREHLAVENDVEGEVHAAAMVEVMSPDLGDQIEDSLIPLLGMTYDPKSNAFELSLEDVDHMAFDPVEIAVIEEDDGFISALEIVRADGVKEIVQLRRAGPPAPTYEMPSRPEG